MYRLAVLTFALILPGLSHAACTGGAQTVFSCTTKGGANRLQVCLDDEIIVYSYGPRGRAPDLTMARSLLNAPYAPWNGIGRYIWEEVMFFNDSHGYAVWYSIDKMRPNAPVEGGVSVTKAGQGLADIQCDRGSVEMWFEGLYDAHARAGLCWDRAMSGWVGCR